MQCSPGSSYFSFLDPIIFLSVLFLNALHICHYLNIRDHISHPCNSWEEPSSAGLTLLACTLRRGTQKILDRMVVDVPLIDYVLNSFMHGIFLCPRYYKNLNFAAVSYDMIDVFTLCLCFACCWRDMNKYLVLSAFDYGPFTILLTERASVLCCTVFFTPVNLHHQRWLAVHLLHSISIHSGFWTFPKFHAIKQILKRNGDKPTLLLQTILNRTFKNKHLLILTSM
jgi:hypothetical protein